MARGIGTFVLILLAGIAGFILGSFIQTPGFNMACGLLFAVATAGGLITYYQASDAADK